MRGSDQERKRGEEVIDWEGLERRRRIWKGKRRGKEKKRRGILGGRREQNKE